MKNPREMGIQAFDKNKSTNRDKKPCQIWWDSDTERLFKELVKAYDEELASATAIVKLIKQAIKDWYLPGYIQKGRKEKTVIANKLAEEIIYNKNKS